VAHSTSLSPDGRRSSAAAALRLASPNVATDGDTLDVMDEDVELLTRWRDGDQVSGRALFKLYFDPLYRFFASKIDEPEEMVQATFLAMVKAKDQFAGRSSLRTYVFRIARHELYRHLRGLRRDRQFDPEVSSIAEVATSMGGRLVRGEDHRRLTEAMRSLPAELQTLLELHYWEDLDAAALADVFEVPAGTIRVRLHRAREALREVMASSRAAPPDALLSIENLDTWAKSLRG
jgi:RNA polymerase sigma-70 factor (ECF subfamily)